MDVSRHRFVVPLDYPLRGPVPADRVLLLGFALTASVGGDLVYFIGVGPDKQPVLFRVIIHEHATRFDSGCGFRDRLDASHLLPAWQILRLDRHKRGRDDFSEYLFV